MCRQIPPYRRAVGGCKLRIFLNLSATPISPTEITPTIKQKTSGIKHFTCPANGQITAESEDYNDKVEGVSYERNKFGTERGSGVTRARNYVQ